LTPPGYKFYVISPKLKGAKLPTSEVQAQVIEDLVTHGADPNAPLLSDETGKLKGNAMLVVARSAAAKNSVRVMQALIDFGGDLDVVGSPDFEPLDNQNTTAMHLTFGSGDPFDPSAEWNFPGENGVKMLSLLLTSCPECAEIKDSSGKTPAKYGSDLRDQVLADHQASDHKLTQDQINQINAYFKV